MAQEDGPILGRKSVQQRPDQLRPLGLLHGLRRAGPPVGLQRQPVLLQRQLTAQRPQAVEGLVAHHPAQPGAELARFHLPGVLPQGQEGVGHHLLRVPGAAPQNRARQAAGKAHVPVHQLLQGGGVPPPQAAQQLPLLQPYHLPAPVSSALSLILTQKPPLRFHRLSKNLSRRKASQSSCGRSRRNQMKIRHFRGHAPRK